MRGIAAALSLAAYCSNIPSLTVPALRHTVLPMVRQIHERLLFFSWLGQASKQREARRLG